MPSRLASTALLLALLAHAASGETVETTAVQGDVPADLVGRWLVVEQNRLPTGMVFPFGRLWEIRQGPEHLELVLRRARLPESVGSKIAKVGAGSGPWIPDDRDLRELAERWDDLPASTAVAERIEHRLVGPEAPAEHLPGDSVLEIVSDERFSEASPVTRTHTAMTVRQRIQDRLIGTFVAESTARTPAPASVALRGDLQVYRLPNVPPRSLIRRLMDAVLGSVEPS